jgi:hypothetical protein
MHNDIVPFPALKVWANFRVAELRTIAEPLGKHKQNDIMHILVERLDLWISASLSQFRNAMRFTFTKLLNSS